MATQNFRVKNGLEVGIGVTIDGTSGIISATKFDGNLRLLAAGESSNSTVYKIHFIATKI